MLQSTKTLETKLVRYIEWSNVQPWVHHFLPIWPHYGHFGPKNSHIWPYLAIGSPSCPKLVEHWLNMVEHRSPHLGWATWTPLHSPKWPWGAWEGPKNGHLNNGPQNPHLLVLILSGLIDVFFFILDYDSMCSEMDYDVVSDIVHNAVATC